MLSSRCLEVAQEMSPSERMREEAGEERAGDDERVRAPTVRLLRPSCLPEVCFFPRWLLLVLSRIQTLALLLRLPSESAPGGQGVETPG